MPDDAILNEVQAAERDLYAAMVAADLGALERMLSPDCVYVHSTAVAETTAEYLAGVARGLYEYESVASRNVRVRVVDQVALVDGVCTMHVGEAGKPKDRIELRFVLAWVRREGRWRLLHRHATRIGGTA